MNETWPTEIRLKDQGRMLLVTFDSGESHSLAAEFLRIESPSAEVKGHGPGQETTVPGKADVKIDRIEPVGNYAVRLIFSDSHATGIYTWSYLQKLGRDHDRLWSAYLEKLSEKGLSRTSSL
jgi:DUF971 family protein